MGSIQAPGARCERRRQGAYNGPVLLEERDSLGWVLKALREAGGSLVSEFAGLDDEALRATANEDDWCLKEIAAHVRDAEELAHLQMTSLIEEPQRPLPVWDIDVLPAERDYRSADLSRVLAEFRALRRETTRLLWGVTEAEWQRAARHPYRGEVTLEQLARELAQHDLEHLWQARRLKGALGV
jgi:hypothetical protein